MGGEWEFMGGLWGVMGGQWELLSFPWLWQEISQFSEKLLANSEAQNLQKFYAILCNPWISSAMAMAMSICRTLCVLVYLFLETYFWFIGIVSDFFRHITSLCNIAAQKKTQTRFPALWRNQSCLLWQTSRWADEEFVCNYPLFKVSFKSFKHWNDTSNLSCLIPGREGAGSGERIICLDNLAVIHPCK